MADQHQSGYIYEAFGAFHVRYYATENRDGVLVKRQKSHKLCRKEGKYTSATCRAVKNLCQDFLRDKVNAPTHTINGDDMQVSDFWATKYLPLMKTRLKPTTLRYIQHTWKKYLEAHFAGHTLQDYTSKDARLFLKHQADKRTLNRTSLKHVRAVASAIFAEACDSLILSVNPWNGVKIPDGARDPENTPHYTREQSEDLVSALVDHVDCQLVIALACFLGLGPAEISGLKWGDIDAEWIHIRRNRVQGTVTTPKTKERMQAVPIIDQVRVPLELWRAKAENTDGETWVFSDLHNMIQRVIKPHVRGDRECKRCVKTPATAQVAWKGLYSGRRGAATMVIEQTGNAAVAQRLLRHKSMTTTLNVYKKTISDSAFVAGMRLLK
jgi:integrase